MSGDSCPIGTDEIRHGRTTVSKTRWTAKLCFAAASGNPVLHSPAYKYTKKQPVALFFLISSGETLSDEMISSREPAGCSVFYGRFFADPAAFFSVSPRLRSSICQTAIPSCALFLSFLLRIHIYKEVCKDRTGNVMPYTEYRARNSCKRVSREMGGCK